MIKTINKKGAPEGRGKFFFQKPKVRDIKKKILWLKNICIESAHVR